MKGFDFMQNLDTDFIVKNISTKHIGRNIRWSKKTTSTNTDAKNNYNLPHGTLFLCEKQTNGRGRLNRSWDSQSNEGIYMSLLLKSHVPPENISQITLVAGIAVCRALSEFAVQIKWPNDIIINSKKVCGILCEADFRDNNTNVICGIGINVNTKTFPPEISDVATSLFLETKSIYKREDIICRILSEFEKLYEDFTENGLKNIIYEYKKHCANLNREARVIFNNKTVDGTAVDITDNGELLIKTNSETISIKSGEASIRGMLGYI